MDVAKRRQTSETVLSGQVDIELLGRIRPLAAARRERLRAVVAYTATASPRED
jgi:hypothetical protein